MPQMAPWWWLLLSGFMLALFLFYTVQMSFYFSDDKVCKEWSSSYPSTKMSLSNIMND